jgi:carboxyl-terminal processing protease
MSPRLKFGVVFFSTLLTLMLVIGAVTGKSKEKDDGAYRPLSVYTEVLAKIKGEYVEEPDMTKVTRGALQGLVEYLDPLSSYLSADQYKIFLEGQKNDDHGSGLSTGLVVQKRNSYTHVLSVLPGSPAAEAGIEPGDFIEALDGLSTRVMPPAYLRSMLSGQPGTSVTVLVRPARHPDEPVEHKLVRTKLNLPAVSSKLLANGIGYISVIVLDAERTNEVSRAVKALTAQGAAKLILDLRGNAWGDPAEGVRLANLFLSSGKIASLKGQQYPEEAFEAAAQSTVTDVPLVVITDRATSGGAEIATAAILDNKRGEVTGERTYGLAAVQKTIPLDDGAALVLSVAKYHRSSGKALEEGGVEPSYPLSAAELRRFRSPDFGDEDTPAPKPGSDDDPFLKKALEILQGQATSLPKAA